MIFVFVMLTNQEEITFLIYIHMHTHIKCTRAYVHIYIHIYVLLLCLIKIKELTLLRKILNFSEIVANINWVSKWKCHYLSSGKFRVFWLPLFLPTSLFRLTSLAEASQDADSRAEVCMQEVHPEHSHKHRKEAESRTDKGVGCTDPEHFCSGADPSECHEQTSI